MPDTKSGRERKGRNKRRQLTETLYEEEMDAIQVDEELPDFDEGDARNADFLADELPEEAADD